MKEIKMLLPFVVLLIITGSCLNRQFVDGWTEVGTSSDTTLLDSTLVFGHIYHVDWPGEEYYRENEFTVWIEHADLQTTNDTAGYYSLKMAPGTYTIKCQYQYEDWERLIEEAKDIKFAKNTQTEINFYIGYTVE